MRRTDRLFGLVQHLRRRRGAVTAAELARELGTTTRTVYRDVQVLVSSGVPIRGEAGVGYVLDKGAYDLPPLMFNQDELEALALGARLVSTWADGELAEAAREILAKIDLVLPEALQGRIERAPLFAPHFHLPGPAGRFVGELRVTIRDRKVVSLAYRDRRDEPTRRTVRPLGLLFWGRHASLLCWTSPLPKSRGKRSATIYDNSMQKLPA